MSASPITVPLIGSQKTILLVANSTWYLKNFRRQLILDLCEQGCDVHLASPHGCHVRELTQLGGRWHEWNVSRSGMSFAQELKSLHSLHHLYQEIEPDVVHHFTMKPILYGTLVARLLRLPLIVNSVTGLGHLFTSRSLRAALVRPFIRRWLNWALQGENVRPMFQNEDDLKVISGKRRHVFDQATMTIGSGVDLNRFCSSTKLPETGEVKILFAGRLLTEKGIYEFVDAAIQCMHRDSRIQFIVCGDRDAGNPSSVSQEQIAAWTENSAIHFLGHIDAIEKVIGEASIVVLPSYREGTPRVLMEGAAAGKPLIATDVPGCREVVQDGMNGTLIPPRDSESLSKAILVLAQNPLKRAAYGANSRRIAEKSFSEKNVSTRIREVYADVDRIRQETESTAQGLKRGAFTFSLDLELAWGTRHRPGQFADYFDGTREAVQKLLGLCASYDVSCTWAAVGGLLMGGRQRHPFLQSEEHVDVPTGDCRNQPHWYAEDLIETILNCRTPQELGCHTTTHRIIDPGHSGRNTLRKELVEFHDLFKARGFPKARSFIFPKGIQGHFGMLSDYGFTAVRGPEDQWFESLPSRYARAAMRMIDASLALTPLTRTPKLKAPGLWMIPSSQFYSPFMSVGKKVPLQSRIHKAKQGLRDAAARKSIFHLWTHPFNLGKHPDELLSGIESIFKEACRLRDAGELDILPMGDVGQAVHQSARAA